MSAGNWTIFTDIYNLVDTPLESAINRIIGALTGYISGPLKYFIIVWLAGSAIVVAINPSGFPLNRLAGQLIRAALAQTFATAGKTKEAIQILDQLSELAKQKYVPPYFFAGIHVGMREDDRAMEYLEKSYEEHSHWLMYLHIDPSMDALRSNPRFQNLLCRIGLPLRDAIPT